MHRIVNARDRLGAKIAIIKQAAKHAARIVCDDNRIWFGKPLKACRKIRGLTNDRLFLGGALTEQITDGSLTIAATFVGKVGAQQPG